MGEQVAVQWCDTLPPLLRKGGEGKIHSVFATALNVEAGGELITLLAAQRSLQPRSVLLPMVNFTRWAAAPANVVELRPASISLPQSGVRVALDKARAVCLSMRPLAVDSVPVGWRQSLVAVAREIARADGSAEGMAPLLGFLWPDCPYTMGHNRFTRLLLAPVQALAEALRQGDDAALARLASKLAGCGPGLTPASDDFLCGVMAALYALAAVRALPHARAQSMGAALAQGACPRTNAISAAFLKNAASGLFSEDFLFLATAFMEGRGDGVGSFAARVARFGATSGCDTLTGFCLGLYMPLCGTSVLQCQKIEAREIDEKHL